MAINLLYEGIAYDDSFSDEDYANESNAILQTMLNIMNEVPMLGNVRGIWSNEQISPPDKVRYIDKIYRVYRDSSGTVTSFERAINKLLGRNGEKRLLAVEMACMAIMIDGTIIWLTFLRGKKNYSTGLAEIRRLLGALFVDDSTDKETAKMQKNQGFCSTMGLAGGILIYVLYRSNGANPDIPPKEDIFSFLFFGIVGLVFGLIAYRLYCMVQGKKRKWENEALYMKWKELWLDGVRDAEELDTRIALLRQGRIPDGFSLSREEITQVEEMWKDEHEQQQFRKYFYDSVNELFQKLQEINCYKYSINRVIQKERLQTVNYISEQMILPCLSEEDVDEAGLKTEFSILQSKHIVSFDWLSGEGYYILTEKFWNLLYDTVLLRLVGGRIGRYDITEELENESEEDNEE